MGTGRERVEPEADRSVAPAQGKIKPLGVDKGFPGIGRDPGGIGKTRIPGESGTAGLPGYNVQGYRRGSAVADGDAFDGIFVNRGQVEVTRLGRRYECSVDSDLYAARGKSPD